MNEDEDLAKITPNSNTNQDLAKRIPVRTIIHTMDQDLAKLTPNVNVNQDLAKRTPMRTIIHTQGIKVRTNSNESARNKSQAHDEEEKEEEKGEEEKAPDWVLKGKSKFK